MTSPSTPLRFADTAAILCAAGQGHRAGQPMPKQFAAFRGKPLLRHAAEAFAKAGVGRILVTLPQGAEAVASAALEGVARVSFITGGITRQDSVQVALNALAADPPAHVLIHDAARPGLSKAMIESLIEALAESEATIPALPIVDSLAHGSDGMVGEPAPRDGLWRVQTPQAFRFPAILAAQRAWQGPTDATDDAQVARRHGVNVAIIPGDEALRKITHAEDFMDPTPSLPSTLPLVRTGMGYDVHRLEAGEDLWLCGIKLEHDKGLSGHSDADVALHAITDAVLGAAAQGDIGLHFPPSDPQWRGASSDRFLAHAVTLAGDSEIAHVDLTLICEGPKIGPHRQAMRERIAAIMGIGVERVSVKATTTERLGFTGRSEGIAAQAVVTLISR